MRAASHRRAGGGIGVGKARPRNAHHVAEDGAVAVPSDPRARPVLGQQHLSQFRRIEPGEVRGAGAQRLQQFRHVVGLLQFAAVEVVPPAIRDHAPIAAITLELEGPERQIGEAGNECRFVRRGHDVAPIAQALGQRRSRFEQAELVHVVEMGIAMLPREGMKAAVSRRTPERRG